MAAQGLRDVGDGQEKVANAAEAAELRARGRHVLFVSVTTALVATGLVVLAETL